MAKPKPAWHSPENIRVSRCGWLVRDGATGEPRQCSRMAVTIKFARMCCTQHRRVATGNKTWRAQ